MPPVGLESPVWTTSGAFTPAVLFVVVYGTIAGQSIKRLERADTCNVLMEYQELYLWKVAVHALPMSNTHDLNLQYVIHYLSQYTI